MEDAIESLEQVSTLLARLARIPFASLRDEHLCEILARTEEAGRLVDAMRVLSAAEVEDRSRHSLGRDGLAYGLGHPRGVHLVEQVTRVSGGEAARRIHLGATIRPRTALDGSPLVPHRPHLAVAMLAGTIGRDAAAAVERCLSQAESNGANPDAVDTAEQDLVHVASHEPADIVAVHARVWREALDPDGAEPRYEEIRSRRGITLGREAGGLTPIRGMCEPLLAAHLRAAFTESSAPGSAVRFLSDEDRANGTETVPTPDGDVTELRDPRTREQRQHDVLQGLLTAGLRSKESGGGGTRSTATVMAVVQLKDLESGSGVGWLNGVDEPVSSVALQALSCDAGYRKVVIGEHGEVLHLGRTERLFSKTQRLALAVRDGGCVWPGCTSPPEWSHAHHVVAWENGGRTDIDNGVLLCPAHHYLLHASSFTMKMLDGKPWLLAPPWIDPDQVSRPLGRSRVTMAA